MKKFCRVCLVMLSVALTIGIAALIDRLDFVARWLGHIVSYKDNLERIFYAILVFVLLLKSSGKLNGVIKNLSVNAGKFGFTIELGKGDKEENLIMDEGCVMVKGERTQSAFIKNVTRNNGQEIARRILNILSDEMNLDFSNQAMLQRGVCNYRPDGFAVKNGHAYIVEIKSYDDPALLRRAIPELKNFIKSLPLQVKRTTAILCIYSSRASRDFKTVVYKEMGDLNIDFMYRVFSREMLEKVM